MIQYVLHGLGLGIIGPFKSRIAASYRDLIFGKRLGTRGLYERKAFRVGWLAGHRAGRKNPIGRR